MELTLNLSLEREEEEVSMYSSRFSPFLPTSCWTAKPSRNIPVVLIPVLVILTLLLAAPGSSRAMKYITPADFPAPGGLLTISEDTTLPVGVGETVTINFDIDVSGLGNHFYIDNQGSLILTETNLQIADSGTCTINNQAPGGILTFNYTESIITNGTLTIHNGGIFQINGSSSLSLTGTTGTFTVENDGQIYWYQNNFQVYGGTVTIYNRNILRGVNWYIKDQFDGTYINNTGSIAITNTTLVSNGYFGLIQLTNEGVARFQNMTLDANYGGQITIDTTNGSMTVWNLFQDASGWSHGKESNITILGIIFNQEVYLPLIIR